MASESNASGHSTGALPVRAFLADELVDLGVEPGLASTIDDAIKQRMSEAHRRYHGIDHVEAVLIEVARLLPFEPEASATAVRLAAWFHDAIYDPEASGTSNERASAELARASLHDAGIDADLVAEVARLVELTAGHRVAPDDRSGAVLADADLAILAAEPDDYDRYATAVRAEYAHVSDELWALGRPAVLRKFLEVPDTLFTAGPNADQARRRASATANIEREIAALEGL